LKAHRLSERRRNLRSPLGICLAILFVALLFLLVSVTLNVYAQQSTQTEWYKTFPIYKEELLNSFIPTSDGGYAFAGTASVSQSATNFWLVKIDSEGNIQWSNVYPEAGDDAGVNSLVQASDGGYLLVGTEMPSGGASRIVLVKTDSSGNLLWNTTVNSGYSFNTISSLAKTKDGDYVIAGVGDNGVSSNVGWLIETDLNGNIVWEQTYGTLIPNAVIPTKAGDFAVAAFEAGTMPNVLMEVNSGGSLLWKQSYSQTETVGIVESLVQTTDGGFAMAGDSLNGGVAFLVETDANGNFQWEQTFDQYKPTVSIKTLVQTSDEGYALGGATVASASNPRSYAFLLKTDSKGNLEWTQTYAQSYTTEVAGLTQNSEGFALAGFQTGPSSLNTAWVIQTDANGNAPASPSSATQSASATPTATQSGSTSSTPNIPEFPTAMAIIVLFTLATTMMLYLRKK
jgi:hypothetical protein